MDRLIIAIDGPAASGKGTLARRLAAHYGLRHLDTGLTYRAVAAELLSRGQPVDDEAAALDAAKSIDLGSLDRDMLSRHEIGEAASRVAVLPALRRAVVKIQRAFAEEPPGAVLDGRDIGTVICPDADVKIFVTATPEVRAARRAKEYRAAGKAVDEAAVL
ncbi:MAG TPA: (d)CMP kinase, partial [Afifellaceae bacterium]|nr:(d)CMP kinase [Afifellaceae bacterium]